nr:hypothetical protein [Tanacetum cinerariifolium]
EEPEPLPGHGDQFDAHPNPQPGNMNGWVYDDDDDVEEEEDEENEDADMEEDDDAEIIFPYEADDEPEAKDADDELEVEEAGESSTARDPQFVGGLAPWALRRDLEALRRQERITEAESETSRTEIAFLGSEAKIGKMERFYLEMVCKGVVPKPPYDDEGSE